MGDKFKIIITLTFFFLFSSVISIYLISSSKNEKIEKALINHQKNLKTQYEIIIYNQKINADVAFSNMINQDGVINILEKTLSANESDKIFLRQELYRILEKKYEVMRSTGILQVQFIQENNISFLRMHKPSKFGDDLSLVRLDIKDVNKDKKIKRGFIQGKTSPGFRNVYPIFKNEKYLGAVEVSYGTEIIQESLTKVSKLHTHFLVHKDIFDAKTWQRDDMVLKYFQSAEAKDFMITMTNLHSKEFCIDENHHRLSLVKDEIKEKVDLGHSFSVYTQDKDEIVVISFYPIYSYDKFEAVAWLVSYENDAYLKDTMTLTRQLKMAVVFILLIIMIFLYKSFIKSTELSALNKDLKESVDNFSELLSLTQEGIVISDDKNKIVEVNHSIEKIFNVKAKDIIGKKILDFVPKNEYTKASSALKEENTKPYEINLLKPDGAIIPTLAAGGNIFRHDKKYRVTSIINLSDVKQRDRFILEQSKLASMGEMIGNIAHQWRQPLSIISSSATGMKLQKEFGNLKDEFFYKSCDNINLNAQFLSKTIDDFRNFIKADKEAKEFNLKDNLKEFLHIVDSSLKGHEIYVIEDLQEDLKVKAYANELIQCYMNIFNNSKDAMKEKQKDKRLFFITLKKKNKKVQISFLDNAGGIDEKIKERIFEPYFTTKHKSQGTGLGLHMTYNMIVDGMAGNIQVQNKKYDYEGKSYMGANFIIELPLV